MYNRLYYCVRLFDKLQHKMFWNDKKKGISIKPILDKLQHKMFWNFLSSPVLLPDFPINFNIRCFEMVDTGIRKKVWYGINFNIRCFEIWNPASIIIRNIDKLQHKMFWNRNSLQIYKHKLRINFNIRCFEMMGYSPSGSAPFLDKLQHKMFWNVRSQSLKSVLKVDKLQHKMFWNVKLQVRSPLRSGINFNIRCFEIPVYRISSHAIDDKLQHKMFWNTLSVPFLKRATMINFNIRCFEISRPHRWEYLSPDKLQHKMFWNKDNDHASAVTVCW